MGFKTASRRRADLNAQKGLPLIFYLLRKRSKWWTIKILKAIQHTFVYLFVFPLTGSSNRKMQFTSFN